MPEENKKEAKERFELVRIMPSDAPVLIQDTKTGEQMDVLVALVKILNTLEQLKKLL